MPVQYDYDSDSLVVYPDDCPDCGQPFYMSGCDAPGCPGLACQDCGTGCDLDFVDAEDGGRCATALDDEDEEDHEERINAERAAFGLSPTGGER
jgi:hypothetical protein